MVRLNPLRRPVRGHGEALFEPGLKWHRASDKESRIAIAALAGQDIGTGLGLHALGNNAQVEGPCHSDDRHDNRRSRRQTQ